MSIKDKANIVYSSDNKDLKDIIENNIDKLKGLVLANSIEERKNNGEECIIGDYKVNIEIIK